MPAANWLPRSSHSMARTARSNTSIRATNCSKRPVATTRPWTGATVTSRSVKKTGDHYAQVEFNPHLFFAPCRACTGATGTQIAANRQGRLDEDRQRGEGSGILVFQSPRGGTGGLAGWL